MLFVKCIYVSTLNKMYFTLCRVSKVINMINSNQLQYIKYCESANEYFYKIRGHLQLTEDSANYVGYCVSRTKIYNSTSENEIELKYIL